VSTNDDVAKALMEGAGTKVEFGAADPTGPKSMAVLLDSKDSKIRPMEDRVIALKKAEESGDLAWMEYTSWFCSGRGFQAELRRLVDPLFWGSAYFERARFVRHLPELLQQMSPTTSGFLSKRSGLYQVTLHNERHPMVGMGRKDSLGGEILMKFNRDGVKDVD